MAARQRQTSWPEGRRLRTGLANVLEVPLTDASVDAVISQEAFCHVPELRNASVEAARILREGGRLAFTDWVANEPLSADDAQLMWDGMAIQPLRSITEYRQLVESSGLRVLSATNALHCEIFGAVRFSSFSTQSAQRRTRDSNCLALQIGADLHAGGV